MTLAIVALLTAAAPFHSGGADEAPAVRVYVFTADRTPGPSTGDEKGRLAALRELRDALAKKKNLRIVDDRADADVVVEVLSREEIEGAPGGFGGKTITKMGDTIIRLRISRPGAEASQLKGVGQGTWGRAAKDAADRVEKWIHR